MRYAHAYDLVSGKFVKTVDARDFTEADRRAYELRCPENKCSCALHWRIAVRTKQNTSYKPATFVKNASSQHSEDCPRNYVEFVKRHRDVAFLKDDLIHLRVSFPLGTAPSDLTPWKAGMLTEAQIRAANNNLDKRSFSNLRDLTDFIEKKFIGLHNDILDDVVLYYQGESYPWNQLFIPSGHYSDLFERATKPDHKNDTSPAIAMVQASREISKNKAGKRRYACEMQWSDYQGSRFPIKPIIVCRTDFIAAAIQETIENKIPFLVAARPFHQPTRSREKLIYLNVHDINQVSAVHHDYWSPSLWNTRQPDLFAPAISARRPA